MTQMTPHGVMRIATRSVAAALAALTLGSLVACSGEDDDVITLLEVDDRFEGPPSAVLSGTLSICADSPRTLGLSVTSEPGVTAKLQDTVTIEAAGGHDPGRSICAYLPLGVFIGSNASVGTYVVTVQAQAFGLATRTTSFDVTVTATGQVTFLDTEFAPANWSLSTLQVGTGGAVSAASLIDDGVPGAWRSVGIALNDPGPDSPTAAYALSAYARAVYFPSAQGAIASIYFSESLKAVAPTGDPQASALLAVQDGETYFAAAVPIEGVTWGRRDAVGLGPAQFTWLTGSRPTRPIDFSATAAPIQFGYVRTANSGAGHRGFTVTSGIDNWQVDVNR